MTEHSIVVENLTYRYGNLLAVDHVSFEVGAGEILGFLGPNGAGKTTTVKMLTGQHHPREGKVTLLGRDIVKETQKVRAQIGVCFEQTNLYEQMTALDNLALFAELYSVKGFNGYALLKRVGLAGRLGVPLAHDAAVPHYHGAHGGVIPGGSLRPRCQFQRSYQFLLWMKFPLYL